MSNSTPAAFRLLVVYPLGGIVIMTFTTQEHCLAMYEKRKNSILKVSPQYYNEATKRYRTLKSAS
jgi:hypothetical protein